METRFTIKILESFTKWVNSLKDKKTIARIYIDIQKLQFGNLNNLKPVGESVQELRLFYGSGYRVYLFFKDGTVIVILCGGDKSTQSKDIKKAIKLKKELE